MRTKNSGPLTPALRELLQACVRLNTTKTERLARELCRAPETVHTEFKRIHELLNVHCRTGAVLVALKHGWITLNASPPLHSTSARSD